MKRILLLLCIFVCGNLSCAQNLNYQEIESELISAFKNYRNADYDLRFDSLRPKIKLQMEEVLSEPQSYPHPFDELADHIKIIKSKDNNVKIFSWDELTGGTMHDMAVIVQFKTKAKEIKTQWIDSDISDEPEGITDAIQFEIHDIKIHGKPYYLSFGWGTYGGGHHHNSILIFSIENDRLNFCSNCLELEHPVIMAPRSKKIDLKFDETENIISFNEFEYDEEIGFYRPTNKRVSLKLKKGKFRSNF